MVRYLLPCASALALLALPTIAAAKEDVIRVPDKPAQALTIERVFASPSLDGPAPRLPKLSPDGRYLALHRSVERRAVVNALERQHRGFLAGHGLGLLRRGDSGLHEHRKRAGGGENFQDLQENDLRNEKGRPDRDALTRYA